MAVKSGELAQGAVSVYQGTVQLKNGTQSLSSGSSAVKAGLNTLDSSANQLTSANNQLVDAANTISKGATDLANGTITLNGQGTATITVTFNETTNYFAKSSDEVTLEVTAGELTADDFDVECLSSLYT